MTDAEKNSKKPVTLESLSEQIGKVDKKVDDLSANLDKKIDNLAGVTKRGFDGVSEEFKGVNKKLQDLELGQEDIKLRLDRAAWKFEMDALDVRVKTLEDKVGVVREKR